MRLVRSALSRRQVLASAAAGASTAFVDVVRADVPGPHEPYFLSRDEIRFLTAACDTLIPGDDFPSASEAGVVGYIDLQLATGYGAGENLYLEGPFFEGSGEQGWQADFTPAALMRGGIAAFTAAQGDFAGLPLAERGRVLSALETDEIDLGDIPASLFAGELWSLTNEGYFADPAYGGNRAHAGWEMVGFPGAHAYYLDSVDNWNMRYFRAPSGITHRPARAVPARG